MDCWFITNEDVSTEQCANIKFCVLLFKSPSETLQTLEEMYGKVAMKKTLVYERHKCFCYNPCCRLEVFFDVQGLIHYELIPEGHTVNKETYVEILKCMRDAMRRKHL
jgi:hypothetical protein